MREAKARNGTAHRLVLAAIGAVLLHGAACAAELSVCLDKSSPSMGRDQSVAAAIAAKAGLTLKTSLFDGNADDDGVAVKVFKKMLATQCDLLMGYPLDTTNGAAPDGLLATAPYTQTGFMLVLPSDSAAKSLADLPKGTDVAVTYETAPNLYVIQHPGLQADVHTSDQETLETLVAGTVKAAMVWQPTLVSFLAAHPTAPKLKAFLLTEPHARWDIVALYAPNATAQAAVFATSLGELKASGELDRILTPAPTIPAATPIQKISADPAAPPALYTTAQASAGAQKFADNCSQCHGPDLAGRAGPALKGSNFASVKAGFSVGDIFTILSQNMPATDPGSLQKGDYVEIMAFLLQQNGYPAGDVALTFDGAGASKVSLVYHGS